MSNKHVVETYIAGFNATDHATILSTLSDDVVWHMPGYFHHVGKAAFDSEIENPNADGHPQITIARMVEEGSVVVAEGSVRAQMKDGGLLDAVFCDVIHFRDGKFAS